MASETAQIERFWLKVDRSGGPEACWTWLGARNAKGYGSFDSTLSASRFAHRIAYELEVGPIPDGLVLHHKCENPPCVNPTHLEPTTHRRNILVGRSFSALNAAKTHCKRGHPLSGDNLKIRKGGRECRTCWLEGNRKRRKRLKRALLAEKGPREPEAGRCMTCGKFVNGGAILCRSCQVTEDRANYEAAK